MTKPFESLRRRATVLPLTKSPSDGISSNKRRATPISSHTNQQSYPSKQWIRQLNLWDQRCHFFQPPIFLQIMLILAGSFCGINLLLKNHIYSHQKVFDFTCRHHPDKTGIFNDDYCDCPDGSDEPNTSACSHVTVGERVFTCNKQSDRLRRRAHNHKNTDDINASTFGNGYNTNIRVGDEEIVLFLSRVGDGIVDCPNTEDE